MDEKKKSKISIWAVLFFMALIVICVMGIFLYKFGAEKNIEAEKAESLNNQITHLQGRAEVLENTLNQISALINEVMTNPLEQTGEVEEPNREEQVIEEIENPEIMDENIETESAI